MVDTSWCLKTFQKFLRLESWYQWMNQISKSLKLDGWCQLKQLMLWHFSEFPKIRWLMLVGVILIQNTSISPKSMVDINQCLKSVISLKLGGWYQPNVREKCLKATRTRCLIPMNTIQTIPTNKWLIPINTDSIYIKIPKNR